MRTITTGRWLTIGGTVLLIGVAIATSQGWIVDSDRDVIWGLILGALGGGAITAKGA